MCLCRSGSLGENRSQTGRYTTTVELVDAQVVAIDGRRTWLPFLYMPWNRRSSTLTNTTARISGHAEIGRYNAG